MRRAAAAGLLALGACAPAVMHGPRVEPGLHAGLSAGLVVTPDTATTPGAVAATLGPYVMYGFGGKPDGVAGSVAVASGGRDGLGMEADVYVQLPSARPAVAYGAGVVASDAYAMPYAQLGRELGLGYDLYTTQAAVWRRDFVPKRPSLDGPGTQVRLRYWAPAVALRRRRGALASTLEVAGALGSFDERSSPSGPTRTRPLAAVTARVQGDVDVGMLLRRAAAITRHPVPRRPPP